MPRKPFTLETGASRVIRVHANGLPRKQVVWRGHGAKAAIEAMGKFEAAERLKAKRDYVYSWTFTDIVARNQRANKVLKGK